MKFETNNLSARSKALYEFYVNEKRIIRAPGQIVLFLEGLAALDTSTEASKLLKTEGIITISKRSGMSRAHPAIAIAKESRATALRIFKQLGIHSNRMEKPGGGYGFVDIVD